MTSHRVFSWVFLLFIFLSFGTTSSADNRNSPSTAYGLGTSLSGGAATVYLAGSDGLNEAPSNLIPVEIFFRSPTLGRGAMNPRSVTGSSSAVMTIPSGATLGQASGVSETTYLYALDNSGTVEMAVSSSNGFDENLLQNTTAISSSATSRTTLYSATARTGLPIKLLGWFKSTQSAAGSWTTAPSEISTATPYSKQMRSAAMAPTVQVLTTGTAYTAPSPLPLYIKVRAVGGGGGASGSGGSPGNGGPGGNSTFSGGGSLLLTAYGGSGAAGSTGTGGAGGVMPTLGTGLVGLTVPGARGQGGGYANSVFTVGIAGGSGAVSPFGGGGYGGTRGANGGAAIANTGSGGGGAGLDTGVASGQAGGGGGSGAYVELIIGNPLTSYTYSIGAGGSSGSAGSGSSATGGSGGSGVIIVEEYYQ